MIEATQVSVVIPAYNEADTIGGIIKRIRAVEPQWEIVVVDDGSTDDTATIAESLGTKVRKHPYNLGNGASVKSGALLASGEYLVFMDADGQHPPEEIRRLIEFLGEYDLVVGARTRQSDTSLMRRIGNWGLITLAQWIAGHKIDDLTSGFRAVKRSRFVEFFHLYPNRYSYPTTITIAMFLSGYFVKYVPLHSITRRQNGKSNVSPLADGLRFINIILRTIMIFAPQRVFVPVSIVLFGLGLVMSVFQLAHSGGIQSASLFLLVSSVLVFLFGLLSEQIAQIRNRPSSAIQEDNNNTVPCQKNTVGCVPRDKDNDR